MIKTRFAPSPTGYLHVGGLRTAMYSYLFAKQNGGNFVLRIEDTDRGRYVEDGIQNILKSLFWAGIIPNEGVQMKENGEVFQTGDCGGSYIQSERLPIYKKYVDELLEKGDAYYCFCTSERLEEVKQFQQLNKLPTGYDKHCREIPLEEAKKRVDAGEKYVVRMKIPLEGDTVFNDEIRGEIRIKNELVDDQVIFKTDGYPTYHLAVVVDDHLMGITHIIRGDEWISSVPKHVNLYKMFGWEIPKMAHLPLLLNADKSKLSKRQGDVSVEDYRKKGYLPEAMINFVAFLGWNPGIEQEIYSLEELIKEFSLEKIGKSGSVFNLEKLDWYNSFYIRALQGEELLKRATPFILESKLMSEDEINFRKDWLIKALTLEKERVNTLVQLAESIGFLLKTPEYQKELLVWKKGSLEEVKSILPELKELLNNFSVQSYEAKNLQEKIGDWVTQKGYSNGSVLWPMRVALSGMEKSPPPFEIAEVLGKEETLKRLEQAITLL